MQHTAGLGTPAHVVSVNTDPHCPMMQMADLAIVADANAVARRAGRARLAVAERDDDVTYRRRRRAGRLVRRHRARPRRAPGAAVRARAVRRQQEHVRRRRLPAHPRRPAPAVVGGGAGPALGDPPLDDGAHRRPRPSPSTTAARRWGEPPYNGATAYRPDFDHWLAGKAEAAGAVLLTSTTVVGLLRDPAGARRRRAHRPPRRRPARRRRDRLRRRQQLPRQGGRAVRPADADHYTLGVKESIALPKEVIDERFNVRGRDGVDIEIVGGTGGVNGGAFVYTNLDTLAVGVVLKLPKLAAQQRRPEEIIASSRPTRRSPRSSRAVRSRSTRPT